MPFATRTDADLADPDVPVIARTNAVVARSDADLAGLDVREALRDGLGTTGAARRHLFGDAAIAAALAADALDVHPGSLTYLAEIVRRGGVGYAADVEEMLPTAEQSALARSWLAAARPLPSVDEACASWLEAVAKILHVRQRHSFRRKNAPDRLPSV